MDEEFKAEDLAYSFGDRSLFRGITFSLSKGQVLTISGRSGCGKSTLLEICAALRRQSFGSVYWGGVKTDEIAKRGFAVARQKIGYVFQKHALIHNFTVFDNIALPLRYHRDLPERDVRRIVKKCMEEMGLFNVDKKFPNELSSGQSRCAAIARAIVMDPVLLFLDEPTAGADPLTAEGITNVLKSLLQASRMAMICICNNVSTIKALNGRAVILENEIVSDIPPSALDGDNFSSIFSAMKDAS